MYYFAYGSNLDVISMLERCPKAGVLQPGCLKGFRLGFTWHSNGWGCGVADVVKSELDEVWGLVYSITDADLEALDRYEGYPKCYGRSFATIHTKDAMLEKVLIYTVCQKTEFVAPSRTYLDIIKRACVDYAFPDSYARMLKTVKIIEG